MTSGMALPRHRCVVLVGAPCRSQKRMGIAVRGSCWCHVSTPKADHGNCRAWFLPVFHVENKSGSRELPCAVADHGNCHGHEDI